MTHKLLKTKLNPPRLPATLVSRSRLVQFLEDSVKENPRPIIISAPAGYGKTTLLVDWLGRSDYRVAWVTLDTSDNDITRFVQYVFAALENTSNQIGRTALELSSAPAVPRGELITSAIIGDFSSIDSNTILVLDDYHVIDNPAIHALVHKLIINTRQATIIAVLTREDPPFALARLRTQDRLIELRAGQLQFSTGEMKSFVDKTSGVRLDEKSSDQLIERTEGWAAGLKLAALSLEGRDVDDARRLLSDFSGSDRHVVDYFGEEVLLNQSDRVKEFFSNTAHLTRMCADLCDAVSRRSDSAEVLSYLTRESLFVTKIEGEGEWYRYHPLFAGFLDVRLGRSQKSALRRRAAQWYADQEMYYDAVQHAAKIDDHRLLGRIIGKSAMSLLENGRYASLLEWMNIIPEEKILGELELATYKAWALYFLNRSGDAYALVLRCEEGGISGGKARKKYRLSVLGDWLRGSLAIPFDAPSLRVNAISRKTPEPFYRFHACVLYGKTQLRLGDASEALKAAEIARQIAQDTGNSFFAACTAHLQAYGFIELGKRSQAEIICSRFLDQQSPKEDLGQAFAGLLRSPAAFCRYLANDLTGANRHLGRLKDIFEGRVNPDYLIDDGRSVEARVMIALHETKGALSIDNPQGLGDVISTDVALRNKDTETAARTLNPDRNDSSYRPANLINYEEIVRLRLLLAIGRTEEVIANLAKYEHAGNETDAFGSTLIANIFLSLAKHQKGEAEQASVHLCRAMEIAEGEDIRRPFLDEGAAVEELIQHTHPTRYSFAWSLLKDFNDEQHSPSDLTETLSKRELEVISAMAGGMSNQEIADTLFISLGTVKWHVNNIFTKLDVKNRTTAINRARDLKLISRQT